MRYRPFGRSGAAVSAMSLGLTDAPMRADHRIRLIYAALESGINTFDIQGRDPAVAQAVGEALATIERQMVFVSLRVGWSVDRNGVRFRDLSPDGVTGAIEAFLARTHLGRLDVAILDLQEGERLPSHVIPSLQSAKSAGRVKMLGVSGGESADEHIGGAFEVLVTPFNLQSGWIERNRLRRASQADMAIIGCNFHPVGLGGSDPQARPSSSLGIGRLFRGGGGQERTPQAYEFLERAPGWTAEQICLGFALTEPSLASVQTMVRDPADIEALASITERELPAGVAAQIEMARISADQEKAALAKRRAGA
jgi:aryl-alcohol dehydrogenase-like predicted oxidoreductase